MLGLLSGFLDNVTFFITGQIDIQAWNLRRSELFTVTRQVAPLNYAPRGAKSAVVDRMPATVVAVSRYSEVPNIAAGSAIAVQPNCRFYVEFV